MQNGRGAIEILCLSNLSNSGTSGHARLAPLVEHIVLDNRSYIVYMLLKLAFIGFAPARSYPAGAVQPVWPFAKREKRAVHCADCIVGSEDAVEALV